MVAMVAAILMLTSVVLRNCLFQDDCTVIKSLLQMLKSTKDQEKETKFKINNNKT